jgi:hypothetical protein
MRTAFWVVLAVAATVGTLWAAQALERRPSVYTDGVYEFSIQAPVFPTGAQGTAVTPVVLAGPAEGGFSSNVNVMVQNVTMTRDAFRKLSEDQFKAAGLQVNAARDLTVQGKDAVQFDYQGTMLGRDLHWLSMAVVYTDRVFVISCTATKDAYPKFEKKFQACLDSFKLVK